MSTAKRQPQEACYEPVEPFGPALAESHLQPQLDELRKAVADLARVVQVLPGLTDDDRYALGAHITLLRAREAALRAGLDTG